MLKKKECIAMILAGGQGSRLYTLTEKTAKPAVAFGGKYRIIDFPMSNCVNSGIDTVGVVTQYQPLVLNEYIGNGQPWDLDRAHGGVTVLSPYEAKGGKDWFRGTANAIYQNLTFIDRYSPEYTLILGGDHIYKMDYSKMLEAHKKNGADCTIAVLEVPMEEASRFGILNTDADNRIIEFEEKPKVPKSNKASMGIYIFTTEVLKKYLISDEADPNSSNDFGKNIIPNMLNDGMKMYSYTFDGYWKDVGTLTSLWEANMEILGKNPVFNLRDRKFRIFYRHNALPPHRVGSDAKIKNAMLTEGCVVDGTVENSVLANGVIVERGAVVKDCVLMSGVRVCAGAKVEYAIIDTDTVVGAGANLGEPKEEGRLLTIGNTVNVPAGTTLKGGDVIDAHNLKDYIG